MNLTTKGRYAVMAMVDIAMRSGDDKPIRLAMVSTRQGIALNYLEQIFVKLKRAGLVKSIRGPGGGYVLAKPASKIDISQVITAVDEHIKMTRCQSDTDKQAGGCMHDKSYCATHALWDGLGQQIYSYLASVSLQDVCDRNVGRVNGELTEFPASNVIEVVHA